jgi:hypothetical protein
MRFVFHIRPLEYLFMRNWYGLRHGAIWTYKMNGKAYLLDIGCFTIGLVSKLKETP